MHLAQLVPNHDDDKAEDDDDRSARTKTRRYLKRIARKAKAEKLRRARLREQRNKARVAGKDIKRFSWAARSKGAPGIFFGEINGAFGYWQRPSARGDAPGLLVRFSDSAKYRPTFLWDKEIGKAVILQNPSRLYAAELDRAMRKLKS